MGGGIGMGNTCEPMAVSFQCMTKSTTIKKLKKIKYKCIQDAVSFFLILHYGLFPVFYSLSAFCRACYLSVQVIILACICYTFCCCCSVAKSQKQRKTVKNSD